MKKKEIDIRKLECIISNKEKFNEFLKSLK